MVYIPPLPVIVYVIAAVIGLVIIGVILLVIVAVIALIVFGCAVCWIAIFHYCRVTLDKCKRHCCKKVSSAVPQETTTSDDQVNTIIHLFVLLPCSCLLFSLYSS